jgi:hypothetical protein
MALKAQNAASQKSSKAGKAMPAPKAMTSSKAMASPKTMPASKAMASSKAMPAAAADASASLTPTLTKTEENATPMTTKNFRNHPDMENFFRFIYENDLRIEALGIIDEIIVERRARKKKTISN